MNYQISPLISYGGPFTKLGKNDRPDVVVMEFMEKFRLNHKIKPAILPSAPPNYDNKCKTSGWGSTIFAGPLDVKNLYSDILKVAEVKLLDDAECERQYQSKVVPVSFYALNS